MLIFRSQHIFGLNATLEAVTWARRRLARCFACWNFAAAFYQARALPHMDDVVGAAKRSPRAWYVFTKAQVYLAFCVRVAEVTAVRVSATHTPEPLRTIAKGMCESANGHVRLSELNMHESSDIYRLEWCLIKRVLDKRCV